MVAVLAVNHGSVLSISFYVAVFDAIFSVVISRLAGCKLQNVTPVLFCVFFLRFSFVQFYS